MKIQDIEINKLQPFKENPRQHSAQQIDQIAKSIKEFGFFNPILIDENFTILAGHGRFFASQQLNFESVPCVLQTGLNDSQKKALIIADNKIASNSSWNEDILWNQIRKLNDDGFDLGILAFEELELLPILDKNVVEDPLAEWDDMPEFEQNNLNPFRSIIVHFNNESDVKNFFETLNQNYSEKAKYIWHPEMQRMDNESKRYT